MKKLPPANKWLPPRPVEPIGDDGWAVAMTTAPRPFTTARATLTALGRAGFPPAIVYAEPESDVAGFSALATVGHLVKHNRKKGVVKNWHYAASDLRRRQPNAAAYLICQDDAGFCRGVRAYLDAVLWPAPAESIALVSLYSCEAYGRPPRGNWQDRRGMSRFLSGAVAWILPAATIDQTLAALATCEAKRNLDNHVGRIAAASGLGCWYHWPSLADHLGNNNSALGDPLNSALRRPLDYPGDDAYLLAPTKFMESKK